MSQYSAKETCTFIDPTNRSHPIGGTVLVTVHMCVVPCVAEKKMCIHDKMCIHINTLEQNMYTHFGLKCVYMIV